MKAPTKLALSVILVTAYAFFGAACSQQESHDHDHDHDDHEHHDDDGHDHGEEKGDDHKEASHDDHDHDHDHDQIEAGPNGGRVLHAVEPHLEFFVTEDRKVQIAALTDGGAAQPIGEQTVTIIGGDRSNPTRMKLVKQGDLLVSNEAFPEGNDFPVVIQIKTSADAKAETEKFNLNLADCPTCEYKEYACTCDHEH